MLNNITNTEKFLSNFIADRITNYFSLPMTFYGSLKDSIEEGLLFVRDKNYFSSSFVSNFITYDQIQTGFDLIISNQQIIIMCLVLYYLYNNIYVRDFFSFIFRGILNTEYYVGWRDYFSKITQGNTMKSTDYPRIRHMIDHLIISKSFTIYYPLKYNIFLNKYNAKIREMRLYSSILGLSIPNLNKTYYFNDKKNKISGYIFWESINQKEIISKNVKIDTNGTERTSSINEDIILEVPVLNITLKTGDPQEYLTMISNQSLMNTEIYREQYYVDAGHTCQVKKLDCYNIKKTTQILENNKKNYIDTFFHPSKDKLWNYLKNIHFNSDVFIKNGQYPQLSLCLYGPPGTGKSSFAYRIAKALGRHLAVIDLRKIYQRHELFSLFMKGVKINEEVDSLNSNGKVEIDGHRAKFTISPENTVYVLDEFDIAVRYLNAKLELEAIRKKKNINRIQKVKNKQIKAMYDFSATEFSSDDESESESEDDEKKKLLEKKRKKIAKKKEKQKEKQKKAEDTTELDSLVKADNGNYSITLDDLLQIFQGPIANTGSIIIATTNNFEDIQKICPRLFRDGRLKPIYFGYPNKETLNEISKYYFDRELNEDWIPEEIRIPPARIVMKIMEIILKGETKDEQYKDFKEMMQFEIENYEVPEAFNQFDNEDITLT